jgi:hypothetical protein
MNGPKSRKENSQNCKIARVEQRAINTKFQLARAELNELEN